MRALLTMSCVAFAVLLGPRAFAAPAAITAPAPAWKSSIELGAVINTGNTDQRSFKFQLDTEHDGPRMRHSFHVNEYRQSQNSVVSADKFRASYQGDYKLTEPNAVFGRISYENDKFSGYDYQEDLTFGYARRLLKRSNMTLHGDLGAGERHSKLNDGTSENEGIVRAALKYNWQVSQSAVFKQHLSLEVGAKNTISRSETSIQTTIAGNLAMKLSISLKHQSNVPLGFKKTDTESSITLVYNF